MARFRSQVSGSATAMFVMGLALASSFSACASTTERAAGTIPKPELSPETSPAMPTTPASAESSTTSANPYLAELEAHRCAFREHGPHSYVFVLNDHPQVQVLNYINLRIVVEDDHVVAATSLAYGGPTTLSYVPTMDTLFERAQQSVSSSGAALPFKFAAHYDAQHGYMIDMSVDGRADVADDEYSFDVACFDTNVQSCTAILLEPKQCAASGGKLARAEQGCEAGWSIGLVDGDGDGNGEQACCRYFTAAGNDQLKDTECAAVGGSKTECSPDMISVGSNATSGSYCCREYVRGPAQTDCAGSHAHSSQPVPSCPEGQVPSVVQSRYAACVPIESCKCADAPDCPEPNQYTCHRYAHHCGPYVR